MIYVYPCDEQTCAAFNGWLVPVQFAFILYEPTTKNIAYVDCYQDIEEAILGFRSISGSYRHPMPSHPPLYIYDPTQPEWQI